ncbi:hypothetical protein [Delftia sp.]|uniref:hypothetical protein n=1 Tax=Delftia sp. TaxID=1886637 RepID=UPI00259D07B8|nr:hypothetical protein [Delftia sp.]
MNYALVDTPERLIGYEPLQLHVVSHIPEHLRLTTWLVERDFAKERAIAEKVEAARDYYSQCIHEFGELHPEPKEEACQSPCRARRNNPGPARAWPHERGGNR